MRGEIPQDRVTGPDTPTTQIKEIFDLTAQLIIKCRTHVRSEIQFGRTTERSPNKATTRAAVR